MNREIRFRAWDKRLNKMVDIQSIHWGGVVGNVSQTAIKTMDYHMGACSEGDTLVANRYELLQYTCLNDKNGVGIFEGDVVKIDADDFSHNFVEVIKDICHIFVGEPSTHWEIIGNIFANPELMEANGPH